MARVFADGGYASWLVSWARKKAHIVLEIVRCCPGAEGLEVVPRRSVVERTFAWLGRQRRLAKDWERLAATTETWIYLAMSRLMAKRLAKAAV